MTHNALASSTEKEKLLKQSFLLSLRSLQDAATKLAGLKHTPAPLNTQSLVNLFICQTTRNRRLIMPPVRIHLRVASQTHSVPIKIRLGATNV
ncbi:hypothetical protein BHOIPH791_13050 [Bartonella henselae]|uniref:Uncharacterized protein n=2 Tax=Bartonella henselae TaxID=38323 RepID=X5M6U0_BARHN|nr:hypothetical protein [Bartonella henselae]ATP12210.1 hypothetical protein BhenCHDE101_03185 [Bartonella henselae]ETS08007.1 hypothetical protein Q653_01104 [Bartonella henselae JK 42]ETS09824.1 hypothetical protein Q654_00098 [Bartonella henselae JK 50]ETS10334.1 hypothetical protein Q655_00049 [Bartonella henselae JK 51]ETS12425.1 hypothetical protein Q652_01234 [Bartonella henselae JK 41]